MHAVDGVVGGALVQLLDGGVPPLRKEQRLVAHHGDPLPPREGFRRIPDHLQHLGKRLAVFLGGVDHAALHVRAQHPVEDGVKVGVVEAGQQAPARKVDDTGFLVDELVDLFIRAHEDDLVALDSHGLGDLVPLVDRDDTAVFEGHVQVGEIKVHVRSAFLFSSGITRARRCPPSEAAGSVVSSLLSFRRIRRADTPPCRRSW